MSHPVPGRRSCVCTCIGGYHFLAPAGQSTCEGREREREREYNYKIQILIFHYIILIFYYIIVIFYVRKWKEASWFVHWTRDRMCKQHVIGKLDGTGGTPAVKHKDGQDWSWLAYVPYAGRNKTARSQICPTRRTSQSKTVQSNQIDQGWGQLFSTLFTNFVW